MLVVVANVMIVNTVGRVVLEKMSELLIATISASRRSKAILKAQRPILPNPLIANLTIYFASYFYLVIIIA